MSLAEAAPAAPVRASSPVFPSRPALRLRRVRPRADLRASLGDAAAFSVMVGLGETYFPAFALALGTGETLAGLVATLPMLLGSALQLGTPWALQRVRSYRRWVVCCVSMQAAALLLMPLAAWFIGSAAAAWVIAAAALYWASSQASGPAWNTWIEEVVPQRLRSNFFACRSRICQSFTLAGFAVGGLALHAGKASGWLLAAFAGIFLLGAACRFLSGWFLSRHSEPSRGNYRLRQVPLAEILGSSRARGGALVCYLLAMQTAVQISGPYFAPYMLGHENLSYLSFMVLVCIGYLGKVIALPLWGRVAHCSGARRLLWIGGTAIVPVAALWLAADWFAAWHTTLHGRVGGLAFELPLSAEMVYLACIQLISGVAWAAYELAMLLMFFEAIPRHDRASLLTYYNFGNSAAQVAGGLIGASILQLGHESHAAYLAVFGISSLMRLCTVPLLSLVPQRPAQVVPPPAPARDEPGPSRGSRLSVFRRRRVQEDERAAIRQLPSPRNSR